MAYAIDVEGGMERENIGVSENMPNEPVGMGRSVSMPSKSDVYSNGQSHTVAGYAERSDLYTNQCFYGVSSIYSKTKNYSTAKLTVRARHYALIGVSYDGSYTVAANSTGSKTFSNLDQDTYYFLQFEPPCDFSGTVKGNR